MAIANEDLKALDFNESFILRNFPFWFHPTSFGLVQPIDHLCLLSRLPVHTANLKTFIFMDCVAYWVD